MFHWRRKSPQKILPIAVHPHQTDTDMMETGKKSSKLTHGNSSKTDICMSSCASSDAQDSYKPPRDFSLTLSEELGCGFDPCQNKLVSEVRWCDFFGRSEEITFLEDNIDGICERILEHIELSSKLRYQESDDYCCFSHTNFVEDPSSEPSYDPTFSNLLDLFDYVLNRCQVEVICIPITLVYIERMINRSNNEFRICSSNWKSTICCCICIASKLFEDCITKNDFFAMKFGCSVSHINRMEMVFLNMLNFDVGIKSEDLNAVCVQQSMVKKHHNHPQKRSRAVYPASESMINEMDSELDESIVQETGKSVFSILRNMFRIH